MAFGNTALRLRYSLGVVLNLLKLSLSRVEGKSENFSSIRELILTITVSAIIASVFSSMLLFICVYLCSFVFPLYILSYQNKYKYLRFSRENMIKSA